MSTTGLMRRLLFSFILIFLAITTYSQWKIEYGIKAGIHRSSIFQDEWYLDNYEYATGWQAGILLRIASKKKKYLTWVFQPEIVFARQGYKNNWWPKEKYDYINVPLIAQRYIGRTGIHLDFGPQAGFPLTKMYNGPYLESGPIDLSADLGIGYFHRKSRIGLDIRAVYGLTSADKNSKEYNRVFSACLMYVFARKKNH